MVDKVQHIQMIKGLSSEDERSAELWLLRRRPKEAEDILLRAQLYRRAVMVNCQLFRWESALAVAQKYARDDVDVVLFLRQRYLEERGQGETLPAFVEMVEVTVDEPRAMQKVCGGRGFVAVLLRCKMCLLLVPASSSARWSDGALRGLGIPDVSHVCPSHRSSKNTA